MIQTRLVIAQSACTGRELLAHADGAQLIAFDPAQIEFDERFFDAYARRRFTAIAVSSSDLAGAQLAAAMGADFFALGEKACLWMCHPDERLHREEGSPCSSGDPSIAMKPLLRDDKAFALSSRARNPVATLLLEPDPIPAHRALELALCDALVPAELDSVKWLSGWIGGRSLAALHSAATLMRSQGRYAVERSEFARLFSTGEPQRGLSLFLQKQRLDFSSSNVVEIK